ncbi:phage head closure protein [Alcaligenes nematophilus]|uniref:phage head closure protein n=1 Tax=Alcaligenes nematophilus TaxID=2994643 RepID=UPI0034E0788D
MRAGKLRHKVSLQERQTIRDPVTGDVVTAQWVEIAKPWAEVVTLSARDFIAAGVNHTKVVARITIRYRENINATMRVVHKGKAYNIEGVLPDPDSGMEYLTLPVSEGVSDGQ